MGSKKSLKSVRRSSIKSRESINKSRESVKSRKSNQSKSLDSNSAKQETTGSKISNSRKSLKETETIKEKALVQTALASNDATREKTNEKPTSVQDSAGATAHDQRKTSAAEENADVSQEKDTRHIDSVASDGINKTVDATKEATVEVPAGQSQTSETNNAQNDEGDTGDRSSVATVDNDAHKPNDQEKSSDEPTEVESKTAQTDEGEDHAHSGVKAEVVSTEVENKTTEEGGDRVRSDEKAEVVPSSEQNESVPTLEGEDSNGEKGHMADTQSNEVISSILPEVVEKNSESAGGVECNIQEPMAGTEQDGDSRRDHAATDTGPSAESSPKTPDLKESEPDTVIDASDNNNPEEQINEAQTASETTSEQSKEEAVQDRVTSPETSGIDDTALDPSKEQDSEEGKTVQENDQVTKECIDDQTDKELDTATETIPNSNDQLLDEPSSKTETQDANVGQGDNLLSGDKALADSAENSSGNVGEDKSPTIPVKDDISDKRSCDDIVDAESISQNEPSLKSTPTDGSVAKDNKEVTTGKTYMDDPPSYELLNNIQNIRLNKLIVSSFHRNFDFCF